MPGEIESTFPDVGCFFTLSSDPGSWRGNVFWSVKGRLLGITSRSDYCPFVLFTGARKSEEVWKVLERTTKGKCVFFWVVDAGGL